MTNYEQAFQKLSDNVGNYFRLDADAGELVFVDPLYGERLGPWPSVLEYDEISRTGRNYLQRTSHKLSVVYNAHGSAEDFTDVLQEHGEVLKAAAVLAVEADWDPAYVHDLANPNAIRMPKGGRREYLQAQIEWAQHRGKAIVPYDLDGPETPFRNSLLKLFSGEIPTDIVPHIPDVSPERRAKLRAELGWAAYNCLRHPMIWLSWGSGCRPLHMPTVLSRMQAW